jgi:branched-chain amino acid transport system substrate-binding protein
MSRTDHGLAGSDQNRAQDCNLHHADDNFGTAQRQAMDRRFPAAGLPFRLVDSLKLVRDMVGQHFQPMAIISPGAPGLFDEEFYQPLGPLADDHIEVRPWANENGRLMQALAATFKIDQPTLRFVAECFNVGFRFEALLIAADAFRRAGSVDASSWRSWRRSSRPTLPIMS